MLEDGPASGGVKVGEKLHLIVLAWPGLIVKHRHPARGQTGNKAKVAQTVQSFPVRTSCCGPQYYWDKS